MWIPMAKKPPKPKVPDAVKEKVAEQSHGLLEILRIQHIKAPPPDVDFSYIAEIYSKWFQNYLYFCAQYCCRAANCISPPLRQNSPEWNIPAPAASILHICAIPENGMRSATTSPWPSAWKPSAVNRTSCRNRNSVAEAYGEIKPGGEREPPSTYSPFAALETLLKKRK